MGFGEMVFKSSVKQKLTKKASSNFDLQSLTYISYNFIAFNFHFTFAFEILDRELPSIYSVFHTSCTPVTDLPCNI